MSTKILIGHEIIYVFDRTTPDMHREYGILTFVVRGVTIRSHSPSASKT